MEPLVADIPNFQEPLETSCKNAEALRCNIQQTVKIPSASASKQLELFILQTPTPHLLTS